MPKKALLKALLAVRNLPPRCTGTRSLIEVHWNSQLCKCFLPLEVKTQTLNFIGAWRIKKQHRETSFCLFSSNLFQLKIKLIPLIIVFNSVNEYIYKTKSFRNLNELKTGKYVVTPPPAKFINVIKIVPVNLLWVHPILNL